MSELLERVSDYLPEDATSLIEDAYFFADRSHDGQLRKSGEPYIAHPLEIALYLSDLRLDEQTIAASLLHDVVEDCDVTLEELSGKFGPEIAKLVDGVTKLTRLDSRIHDPLSAMSDGADYRDSLYAESLRKMLVAMAEDIRVVLIKLADRLHNMKTLDALPPEKQRRIAQETLDIYSPLAHRLGIWEIKWQLDDLAFRHLDIDKYREISRMLSARRVEREEYVERVSDELRLKLDTEDIKAEVSGRPKNIYSTYRKIQKYEAEGKMLSDIYDLFALRVLVEKEIDCYRVLGVVHQLWHPIPGQIDDYISNAKENGYQALHTTVLCEGGTHLEVQIKTVDMHQVAEYGVAAHWRYKEGKTSDVDFEEKMSELRQLLEWQRDVTSTAEFIESVKQDILRDQVFVYTPKGRIVELTAGSTPVDFAYKIHTELGHRCVGAKVNGRLVSLDTPLQNGDTVEIMSTKSDRGPSLDWLNPNRGYVRSAGARQSIRQWFNRQKRETNIRRGREILRREMRRLNQKFDDSEVLALFKHDTMDELLVNLGSGGVAESQLAQKLVEARQEPEHPLARKRTDLPLSSPTSGITVQGVGDMLTRMGPCCNPIPGDEILGFVTRSRGVTVHKRDCPNVKREDEPERFIHVDWGKAKELYPVRITMVAYDRVGLLNDLTRNVSEEGVNMASVNTGEYQDGKVTMTLTVFTTGMEQLGKLFAKLEGIRGCISVHRERSSNPVASR
ncbi:MAG: bifunctional (p)ppGpp synthetase/guanosine-3',5'-bis(diphosphate) 3'-pyrophosphohydrolase [Chloroflexi bacterium]|nr:bifunctional (p)ppGpp synthetase/guanosine-3',5'-bis(diphosphate) 3'-pyrophosphohydrolase [Chloroflexota bacterium]MYE41153.1 bifunctional (p)ppGpp synthetase/guanosine-3',5'-bis(diphosphate) 3'-pyrophosphohydrolase [Chloroflexota bacterium]